MEIVLPRFLANSPPSLLSRPPPSPGPPPPLPQGGVVGGRGASPRTRHCGKYMAEWWSPPPPAQTFSPTRASLRSPPRALQSASAIKIRWVHVTSRTALIYIQNRPQGNRTTIKPQSVIPAQEKQAEVRTTIKPQSVAVRLAHNHPRRRVASAEEASCSHLQCSIEQATFFQTVRIMPVMSPAFSSFLLCTFLLIPHINFIVSATG